MKKMIALLFSAVLTASLLLTGCGGGGEKDASSGKNPLELTIHMHYWGNTIFNDDWEVFKKAEELTNVRLKGTASQSATDSDQVFNIMMASGKLSDIIHTSKTNANKYGIEGALIPLNDLIDKKAPNIKRFLEENPDVKKHMTAPDGNIYFISFVGDGEAAQGYYIRQDWLNKLGLNQPKNTDELYNVLKAFRDKDPNQNGIKDEVPVFFRNHSELLRMVTLFGCHTDWFVEDGQVKFGKYTQEFKDGISAISKWYKEKLIDPEVFTRGNKSREEFLGNDTGGMTRDWFGSTASFNDKLKDKIPGFNFVAMAPPADKNGRVWEESCRSILGGNGWGISHSNKNAEQTMEYFDFWFTEEGRNLMNFGIEGVHYDLVDGKPKFKDEILNGNEPVLQLLNKSGAQIEIGFWQNFDYERQWLTPAAQEGINLYVDNGYIEKEFPSLSFTVEEQQVLDEKWPSIYTYIEETIQKWILQSDNPAEEFDAYIDKLRALGMEEVVDVYQTSYNRYQS